MNTLQIEIGLVPVIINVIIRVITAVLFLAFIIPLQIKEAHVKNGLKKLRRELLISGCIIFLVNTIGLSIIVFRQFVDESSLRMITEVVTLLNSLGFLTIAGLKYTIYTQQYSPEQKRLHAKFEKMELAAKKQAKKKKAR